MRRWNPEDKPNAYSVSSEKAQNPINIPIIEEESSPNHTPPSTGYVHGSFNESAKNKK